MKVQHFYKQLLRSVTPPVYTLLVLGLVHWLTCSAFPLPVMRHGCPWTCRPSWLSTSLGGGSVCFGSSCWCCLMEKSSPQGILAGQEGFPSLGFEVEKVTAGGGMTSLRASGMRDL